MKFMHKKSQKKREGEDARAAILGEVLEKRKLIMQGWQVEAWVQARASRFGITEKLCRMNIRDN